MISEKEFERVINGRFTEPVYNKLKAARVGVAGLGGLGSHIALSLARCGIGYIHIVDFDTVDISNLNRQMYMTDDIGARKTDVIKERISQINPYITVRADAMRVDRGNAARLFSDCDIICEAFDVPKNKAELVNTLLEQCPQKYVISGSGMAGFADANIIKTKRITDRFYICGDGVNGIENGIGLVAPRVMICAGHQALAAVQIILEKF